MLYISKHILVASFLTYDHGELFVGFYVNGVNGKLRRYGLSGPAQPELLSEMEIPQRIQGITIAWDEAVHTRYMLLSQKISEKRGKYFLEKNLCPDEEVNNWDELYIYIPFNIGIRYVLCKNLKCLLLEKKLYLTSEV